MTGDWLARLVCEGQKELQTARFHAHCMLWCAMMSGKIDKRVVNSLTVENNGQIDLEMLARVMLIVESER